MKQSFWRLMEDSKTENLDVKLPSWIFYVGHEKEMKWIVLTRKCKLPLGARKLFLIDENDRSIEEPFETRFPLTQPNSTKRLSFQFWRKFGRIWNKEKRCRHRATKNRWETATPRGCVLNHGLYNCFNVAFKALVLNKFQPTSKRGMLNRLGTQQRNTKRS